MNFLRAPNLMTVIKTDIYEAQRLLLQFEAKAEEMQGMAMMYRNRLARLHIRLVDAEGKVESGKVDIPLESLNQSNT